MIGIAMALKPALLIADEPTTAIDSITQYEILEEFVRIKKEHDTAMIFITHDLGAISKVADDLVVMNSGTIAQFRKAETPYLCIMRQIHIRDFWWKNGRRS